LSLTPSPDAIRAKASDAPIKNGGLRFGPLGRHCVHLCVDMQRMFAEATEWRTPWLRSVLPNILRLVELRPAATIFTRFIPADRPGEGPGAWRRYYERWSSMTLQNLSRDMVELVPELAMFVPPAAMFDKRVYSPWRGGALHGDLLRRSIDTLIVSGGETDVCVLSTVLGAIDYGYRVVIVSDALCSSSDETHDALLALYETRYGQQIEAVTTDEAIESWK